MRGFYLNNIKPLLKELPDLANSFIKRRLLMGVLAYITTLILLRFKLYILSTVFFIIIISLIFLIKISYVRETIIYILVFFIIGCLVMGIATHDTYEKIADGQRIRLSGKVIDKEEFDQLIRYTISLDELYFSCFLYTEDEAFIGDDLIFSGVKESFSSALNDGQFDEAAYYLTKNVRFLINDGKIEAINNSKFSLSGALRKARMYISKRIDELDLKNGAIIKGILLGDKSDIDEYEKFLYQRGGISHILSISGLHATNLSMIICFVLEKIRIRRDVSGLIASIFLGFYSVFAGFSASVVRAVIMFAMAKLSAYKGRGYDIPTTLALSFFIYSLIYPFSIFSQGAVLSYSACIVIWVYSNLYKKMHIYRHEGRLKKLFINKIYRPFSLSLFFSISTLPIVLFFFYSISWLSVLINLYVIPMMSFVFIFGIMFIALIFVNNFLAVCAACLCDFIISGFTFLTELSVKSLNSVAVIGKPSLPKIIFYYFVLLIILFLLDKIRHRAILMTIMIFPIFVLIYKSPNASLTMLDVDQGDCFVISTEEGEVYMVDCGSSGKKEVFKYIVEPYLMANGIKK